MQAGKAASAWKIGVYLRGAVLTLGKMGKEEKKNI